MHTPLHIVHLFVFIIGESIRCFLNHEMVKLAMDRTRNLKNVRRTVWWSHPMRDFSVSSESVELDGPKKSLIQRLQSFPQPLSKVPRI